MPYPKSVTKIKKDGVEYISNVDAVNYTIVELTRAALKDIAKLLRKRIIQKLKLLRGMKRQRRLFKSTQYWVRKIKMGEDDPELVIGFKHDTWYGVWQELGSNKQPKRGILRETVFENIDEIIRIQSKYLSGISEPDGNKEEIDESEGLPNDR